VYQGEAVEYTRRLIEQNTVSGPLERSSSAWDCTIS